MSFLKIFNKEQWTAVATAGICLILLVFGLAGGVSAEKGGKISASDREYERPRGASAEMVAEKYEVYGGTTIYPGQSASRLAVPYVRPPQPRAQELPAPRFRPGPATKVLNGLDVKLKYPKLSAAAPVVPDTALPSAADLAGLKGLEEPAVEPQKDRRLEKEREHYTIIHKRTNRKYEGRLLGRMPDGSYILQIAKSGARITFKPGDVREVLNNDTWEVWYRKQSQKIRPGADEAGKRTALAKSAMEKGMIPEAKEELGLALKARPDYAPAALLLGKIAYDQSDFNGAVAAYEKCLEELSTGRAAADLHYEKGRCLRAVNFLEGAAASFENAIDASPLHAASKLALARTQLEMGDHARARASANDFIVKLGRLRQTPAPRKAEGFLLRGLGLLAAGKLGPARADFQQSLQLVTLPETVNAVAAVDAVEGKLQEAATGFVKAIQADQYQIDAWTNLGALLLLAGRWADAEAIYIAASQRDPVSVEAVVGRTVAQIMAGRAEAEATLQRALDMDPGHAQAHMVMGYLKLQADAADEALRHYRLALQADYSYLPAYSGAAAAYLANAEAADEAEAEKLRVSAATLLRVMKDYDTTNAGTLTALGCAYAAMRQPEDAQQELREAIAQREQSQKPVDPLIFYALGYVDYHWGPGATEEERITGSVRTFRQAVQLKAQTKDPFGLAVIAECEAVLRAIEEWLLTVVRFDETFQRPSSSSLGPSWVETEGQYGLDVILENFPNTGGRAKIFGNQAIKDFGLTSISRDIPPREFYAMESTFIVGKPAKVEFGLSILTDVQGDSRIGFHLAVDQNGRVKFRPRGSYPGEMDGRDTSVGWSPIRTPLPDPKEITFRITRLIKNRRSLFTVWFWNEAQGQWMLGQKDIPIHAPDPPKANWRVSIWARALRGQEVVLYLDNIRVFERSER